MVHHASLSVMLDRDSNERTVREGMPDQLGVPSTKRIMLWNKRNAVLRNRATFKKTSRYQLIFLDLLSPSRFSYLSFFEYVQRVIDQDRNRFRKLRRFPLSRNLKKIFRNRNATKIFLYLCARKHLTSGNNR